MAGGAASFIPKLFLVGAFLGAIGCLTRPDYNLPIFLFSYISWSYLTVNPFSLNARTSTASSCS